MVMKELIDFEIMVVFVIITFETILTVDALLGADESQFQIVQRDAIVGVPTAQHRARYFAGYQYVR